MAHAVNVWTSHDMDLYRIDSSGQAEYLFGAGVFRIMQGDDGWRVILHGYFPMNLDLFQHGGAMFEVCHNPCGPPGKYENGTCVMRFSKCEIVRKWIRQPVTLFEDGAFQGCIELSCDVWITEEMSQ